MSGLRERGARRWVVFLAVLLAPLAPATAQGAAVARPVAFSVVNVNHSAAACTPDGRRYVLRGSLVATPAALKKGAVTILVHGAMLSGDVVWRMHPGGDTTLDVDQTLADAGHAVVSVAMVGYLDQAPPGELVCQGSEADTLHQIAEQLRRGSYDYAGGARAPAFRRINLFGSSFGAQAAQIAVYSFPGDFDALILQGWADPTLPDPPGAALLGYFASTCFGGKTVRKFGASGPSGYIKAPPPLVLPAQWHVPDRVAQRYWVSHIESDPCGILTSAFSRAVADFAGLPSITIPTLVLDGQRDSLVGWMAPHVLLSRLTGVKDKTLELVPNGGHQFFFEPARVRSNRMISDWLGKHGF